MGPGIVIPIVVLLILVPAALLVTRRRFKDAAAGMGAVSDHEAGAPAIRLTSNALRNLATPPWRVVYEIGHDKLDGLEHVLIGPAGVFAVHTSMDPLPEVASEPVDQRRVAEAAIVRGGLDDALRRCAMSSDRLVVVHWGVNPEDAAPSVEPLPGVTAVDGRRLVDWSERLPTTALSPAQVDLAWQTVVTAIGRPDPLR